MVRIVVLQKLYGLSDEQVGYQILDWKTFQHFVGLEDSSQVPDRMTVWEFRDRLVVAGAETDLLDAVDRELNRHGYLARGGRMDARQTAAKGFGSHLDEKAWQIPFRVQAYRQYRQALQANPETQGANGERTRYPAPSGCAGRRKH
jgi:IS5 family transposase